MANIKVLNKGFKLTADQKSAYDATRKAGSVTRNTNLRFGRIVVCSDQDLDG